MTLLLVRHLAALALWGADVVVRGVRIRLLVPGGEQLSLWHAITVNAYGEAGAAVTPGRVGGDPARFLGFRRAGIDAPPALAGLGVELLIDWVLLGVAAVVLGVATADTAATGLRRIVALATGREARLLVAALFVLIVASAVAVRRYHRRVPAAASVAEAWRQARRLGPRTLAAATTLTAISMVCRTAILPVLVAGHAGINPGAVLVGSFALLYGQLVLPIPAGVGGVELGFVAGFAGTLRAGELAVLLVAWRIYTLILGAALGAVLLARASLGRGTMRRSYSATSSVNVRSQP